MTRTFMDSGARCQILQQLITEKAAVKYELTENYRSKNNIVNFSNAWASGIIKSNEAISMLCQSAGEMESFE